MNSNFTFFFVLVIILSVSDLTFHSRAQVKSEDVFSSQLVNSFQNFYDFPIKAYKRFTGSSQYLAYDNLLASIVLLQQYEFTESSIIQPYLLDSIEFVSSYLKNPYLSEKRGVVSWFDSTLGDLSYPRSPRYAKDQALYLYALSLAERYADTETQVRNFRSEANNTWVYLTERFYDSINGGWFSHLLLTDESEFRDETKRTFDNMLISYFLSQIDPNYLSTTKDQLGLLIKSTLDFFRENIVTPNHGIVSFATIDGDQISSTYFARDNALYGLMNLFYYNEFETGNPIYLNEARNAWKFLNDILWDSGFGGLFSGTDGSVPVIAGKGLEDQIQFALLSLNLWEVDNDNPQYLDKFLETNKFIKVYLINPNTGRFYSSVDRFGRPSDANQAISNFWGWYYLVNSPRIISLELKSDLILGIEPKIEMNLFSPINQEFELKVIPSTNKIFKPKIQNVTIDGFTRVSISVPYADNPQSGGEILTSSLILENYSLDTFYWNFIIDENTRIPNGFLYIFGAGLLILAIIILRRPPVWLKERASSLQSKYNEFSKDLSEIQQNSGDKN